MIWKKTGKRSSAEGGGAKRKENIAKRIPCGIALGGRSRACGVEGVYCKGNCGGGQ